MPAGPVLSPTSPVLVVEGRVVELEWPGELPIGDSDIVRLALIPSAGGYVVESEFSEHRIQTLEVPVERPQGYLLSATARLDGVGFEISPPGPAEQTVPENEKVQWRWSVAGKTPGMHRLAVSLVLRWTPEVVSIGPVRELQVYSRGFDIRVTSFLGLSRAQALAVGVLALLLGGVLTGFALVSRSAPGQASIQTRVPNEAVEIELLPGTHLEPTELSLMKALFQRYRRLVLEQEFHSGYSGARTFLVQPVHIDGRADARTIVKSGSRTEILREFQNYETYVKDSLPPLTARIQRLPVSVRGSSIAALQYTFIAQPGRQPTSFRQALLADPDPALLYRLFDTFGPNWWMQRRPYLFHLAQEYDRLLPPHYVLEPVNGVYSRPVCMIHQDLSPADVQLSPGDIVQLKPFDRIEMRQDGVSFTLTGKNQPGQPELRLRWLGAGGAASGNMRVKATRLDLLRDLTRGFHLQDMPNPLDGLPGWLNETVSGTQSIIHGDLNLENILVGPGGLVWLIDFAQTRLGHPLFDFARLEVEIIAHILTTQERQKTEDSARQYAETLHANGHPLLDALHEIATRCLFNSQDWHEYSLALRLACMGALKFSNLTPFSKEVLFFLASLEIEIVHGGNPYHDRKGNPH
jgi:hypothetical protein